MELTQLEAVAHSVYSANEGLSLRVGTQTAAKLLMTISRIQSNREPKRSFLSFNNKAY